MLRPLFVILFWLVALRLEALSSDTRPGLDPG